MATRKKAEKLPSDDELARTAVETIMAHGVAPEAPLTRRAAGEQAAVAAFTAARAAMAGPKPRRKPAA